LSQKIPSSSWSPRPDNLRQNGLKLTPLMMSSTKKAKPKTYNFFNYKREDFPLEGLNSSLAQSPGKFWSCQLARK